MLPQCNIWRSSLQLSRTERSNYEMVNQEIPSVCQQLISESSEVPKGGNSSAGHIWGQVVNNRSRLARGTIVSKNKKRVSLPLWCVCSKTFSRELNSCLFQRHKSDVIMSKLTNIRTQFAEIVLHYVNHYALLLIIYNLHSMNTCERNTNCVTGEIHTLACINIWCLIVSETNDETEWEMY